MNKNLKTGFIDVENIMPKVLTSIDLRHNVCFRGKTGTGKTFLVKELARAIERPLIIMNMTTHTSVEEIKGKWVIQPKNDNTSIVAWVKGLLVRAMESGSWILIEEWNFMNEELSSVFYSVMDDRKEIVLDEHLNEVVKAKPSFRIFLTMNWDYRGTVRPNAAIMNRINSFYDINYLPVKEEAELIVERTGIDKDTAVAMAKWARHIRSISEEEDLPDLSTRILLNWAEMIRAGYKPLDAAEHSVIPLLGYKDEEKQKIRETLRIFFAK